MGAAEYAKLIGTSINEMCALSGFKRRAIETWYHEQRCRFDVIAMGTVCKRTKIQIDKERQLSKEELAEQFDKQKA